MKVYLDNAATTPLDKEVLQAMLPFLEEQYGNPSSIHSFGRQTRTAIEQARKTVAKNLNVSPAEIFFTSGGTEADNMAIRCAVNDYQIKHIITSCIEHHAVLHTAEELRDKGVVSLSFVKIDSEGTIDLQHLEELLQNNKQVLVSLMHANNELGTLLPIKTVGELCKKYNALFHSDTVQTMAHYKFDLQDIYVNFVVGAAHKFHGPKGVGFLYVRHDTKIHPLITGGAQERNMRGGTENLYGIVGLAKALDLANEHLEKHQAYIQGLKSYMKEQLLQAIPGVTFNGNTDPNNSLYTVLSVSLPPNPKAEMMLFNLDIAGIASSGGSACTSGSDQGSHVLRGIGASKDRPSVRFSFSKMNTKEEIDYVVNTLKTLLV